MEIARETLDGFIRNYHDSHDSVQKEKTDSVALEFIDTYCTILRNEDDMSEQERSSSLLRYYVDKKALEGLRRHRGK